MTVRLSELSHIEMDRVAVSYAQARSRATHGLQATLTPLRFEHGAFTERRGRRQYKVEQVLDAEGRAYLYILSFYLPRFLNLPMQEKIDTVVHELWHISPRFDGDLRRFEGRCYAHGRSQAAFDREAHALAQRWLALDPPLEDYGFLTADFAELSRRHGCVVGTTIAAPKLMPCQ